MKTFVEKINDFSASTTGRNGIAIFCSTGRINGGSIVGSKLLIM